MAKEYDLDVEMLTEYDGGDWGNVVAYYSKGHHSTEAFIADLVEVYEPDMTTIKPEKVRQTYCRKTPWTESSGVWDGMFQLVYTNKPGPGAFPVTVLDL